MCIQYIYNIHIDKLGQEISQHVWQVRNQKQCGSCVAFSNMAAIEVCFKKLTGSSNLDYSEQQLVDCGYGQNGASGCNGAYTYSYLKVSA